MADNASLREEVAKERNVCVSADKVAELAHVRGELERFRSACHEWEAKEDGTVMTLRTVRAEVAIIASDAVSMRQTVRSQTAQIEPLTSIRDALIAKGRDGV